MEPQIEETLTLEEVVKTDKVFDNIFTIDSPEVIYWTNLFKDLANIDKMFMPISEINKSPSLLAATVVGTFWHQFSAMAPKVMCIGAGKLDSNEMRHYVIQPIYEELGKRRHQNIHPDKFLDCIREIGIYDEKRLSLIRQYSSRIPLLYLRNAMETASSDQEILGIFLGLEINAEENIETLIDSLSYNSIIRERVLNSWFFRVHRVAEEEHTRLNVANFLRFSPTEDQKAQFKKGFHKSVFFWKKYWEEISNVIKLERLV